jgi:hypothetical protein
MKWLLFVFVLSAHAEVAKTDWALTKGKLTYHVSFPLKSVEGVSENVKGKGHCEVDTCEFLIGSPVKSFESGDGNRDNHMIEVTKGGKFPVITVRLSVPKSVSIKSFTGMAEINFGGEVHTYQVPVSGRSEGGATIVSGKVPLKLSDFKMERPALLGVKIKDEVPVDFELRWE